MLPITGPILVDRQIGVLALTSTRRAPRRYVTRIYAKVGAQRVQPSGIEGREQIPFKRRELPGLPRLGRRRSTAGRSHDIFGNYPRLAPQAGLYEDRLLATPRRPAGETVAGTLGGIAGNYPRPVHPTALCFRKPGATPRTRFLLFGQERPAMLHNARCTG